MGYYTDNGYDLDSAKTLFAAELGNWYAGSCLDTFDYAVGGVVRRFECNEAAQLRMINGRISNISNTLYCGTVVDPNTDPTDWTWHEFTATECGKIHQAYLDFSKANAQTYSQLKAELAACTTVAEVDAMFTSLFG